MGLPESKHTHISNQLFASWWIAVRRWTCIRWIANSTRVWDINEVELGFHCCWPSWSLAPDDYPWWYKTHEATWIWTSFQWKPNHWEDLKDAICAKVVWFALLHCLVAISQKAQFRSRWQLRFPVMPCFLLGHSQSNREDSTELTGQTTRIHVVTICGQKQRQQCAFQNIARLKRWSNLGISPGRTLDPQEICGPLRSGDPQIFANIRCIWCVWFFCRSWATWQSWDFTGKSPGGSEQVF